MLYLFHGKDTIKSHAKLKTTVESFFKKNPHSNIFRFTEDVFDKGSFLGHLGSQSLFSDKFLIICEDIFKNDEAKEVVLDRLDEIRSSPNIFIFVEDNIKKGDFIKLAKGAEKIFTFDLPIGLEKEDRGFNIFSISDAFGEKDKKKIWVLYQKAIREDIAPEEVFWKFVWQVKNMLLAKIAEDKGDRAVEKLKIAPFVLMKAKKYSKNFSEEELKKLYGDLVSLYHDSRRGVAEFDNALEGFILNL